jgi:hypothetical protein
MAYSRLTGTLNDATQSRDDLSMLTGLSLFVLEDPSLVKENPLNFLISKCGGAKTGKRGEG